MSELKRRDDEAAMSQFFSPADAVPLIVSDHSGAQHQHLRIERTEDREVIEASRHTVFTPVPVARPAAVPSASPADFKPLVWLCSTVAFVLLILGGTALAVYAQHLQGAAHQRATQLSQENQRLQALTQSQEKRIKQAQKALCAGQ